MEWWHWALTLFGALISASVLAILKGLVSFRIEFASFRAYIEQWVKGTDEDMTVLKAKIENHHERFGWGSRKIQKIMRALEVIVYRLKKLEEKSDEERSSS